MYFSDTGEDVLLLDFEHASASHNLFLAQVTDLGNYYGRMWPNPEMQREFLNGFLAQSTPETLDENYKLIRTTAVFGALFLAKYGMAPDHGEHQMSVSLLGNLEQNLASLDAQYTALKANPSSQQ